MSGRGAGEHPHGADRLCAAGESVYSRAVRHGRVPRREAETAPCLLDLALLHPDPDDMDQLVPTSPQEVIARLLRDVYAEVSAGHRRMGAAVAAVERFTDLTAFAGAVPRGGTGHGGATGEGGGTAIRVLDGLSRIRAAMDEATDACTTEVLTVQPGGIRREHELSEGLHRALALRRRGVRMRDLYTHVARHGQGLLTYMELMEGAAEARTLDEVIERLILFDRTVAFIPANAEHTVALELRHPAIVAYLATVFERLWRLAIPLGAALPQPGVEGISHREQSIAALLAEGHQDAVIAERLGISVRTCRAHIARLSERLGAASRTQLGVRIAQAGLDKPSRAMPGPAAPPARTASPKTAAGASTGAVMGTVPAASRAPANGIPPGSPNAR